MEWFAHCSGTSVTSDNTTIYMNATSTGLQEDVFLVSSRTRTLCRDNGVVGAHPTVKLRGRRDHVCDRPRDASCVRDGAIGHHVTSVVSLKRAPRGQLWIDAPSVSIRVCGIRCRDPRKWAHARLRRVATLSRAEVSSRCVRRRPCLVRAGALQRERLGMCEHDVDGSSRGRLSCLVANAGHYVR